MQPKQCCYAALRLKSVRSEKAQKNAFSHHILIFHPVLVRRS
jgi:hypothetical protein